MEGITIIDDKWGYPVRTSSDSCVGAINSYYTEFLSHGRKASVIYEAVTHDESCVLANTLAAYVSHQSDYPKSQRHLNSAESQLVNATPYEKAVFAAISTLVVKNRDDQLTYDRHSELLKQYPKDLASLKRAQILCFFMGQPEKCLSLVEMVLPENQEEDYIHGIHCFPLLELDRMEEAKEAADKGLKIKGDDIWSQHGYCHVLQYECRFKDAAEFMREKNSPSWESCSSFMLTHCWWHTALCYLDGRSPIEKVLEIYDLRILKELEKEDASPPEVYLNAIGLLMRVYIRGYGNSMDERLKILVDVLTDQRFWHLQWHLDILILWALSSSTDKIAQAETLLKEMKSKKKGDAQQNGIQLAEGLFEFGQKNYEKAFEFLGPNFDTKNYKIIGASDEQLDVFKEVWYHVLLETKRYRMAINEIGKQIQKTEGVPFLWLLLERACEHEGTTYEKYLSKNGALKWNFAHFPQQP